MKYITKSIFSKLMELFKSVYFFKAYIFSEINSDLLMLQHRPAFHIRSVQMSTERKMCCMESFLVTICTAPFPSWRQLDHDHVSIIDEIIEHNHDSFAALAYSFLAYFAHSFFLMGCLYYSLYFVICPIQMIDWKL